MGLYVAADGSYGDSEGIAIINDSDWTEFEYSMLDYPSINLADFAEGVDSWVKKGRPLLTRVGGYHFDMESVADVAEAIEEMLTQSSDSTNPVVTAE
jgi:hypothetical protein